MINYVSLEEILYLHERIISQTGGSQGIRDFNLLYAAVERPKASFADRDLYRDIFSKAAALVNSLILNHPFVDGNKRTAIACCLYFLENSGVELKTNFRQLINFALRIESKQMRMKEITFWLREKSK